MNYNLYAYKLKCITNKKLNYPLEIAVRVSTDFESNASLNPLPTNINASTIIIIDKPGIKVK